MSMTAEQIDDFDAGFDDGEEGGLSGFYVLAIFLGILAAFLVIVWFAYQKGLALGAEQQLPAVAADPRPVREDVPVALGTENPREEVYARLEGVTPTTVIAEANPAADPLDGYDTAGTAARETLREETPADTAPAATPNAAPDAAIVTAAPDPVVSAPTPAPARPEPRTPAPAAAPTPTPIASSGTHVVQVGAFGSDEEALRFFSTLSGKHGSFVGDKAPDIQRADVNGRTYHRLRLAPFASKAAAQGYCTELKAKGQDCLVRAAS